MHKNLVSFPLTDITTPKNGATAYVDYFWLTKDGNAFKAKLYGSPQCNKDKRIVERVYGNLIANGYEVTHIPVAYVTEDNQ